MKQEIVFTRAEITALADFAATQGKDRTYRVVRDSANVLHVMEPSSRLIRLSTSELRVADAFTPPDPFSRRV